MIGLYPGNYLRWKISHDPHAVGTDKGNLRDAGEVCACQIIIWFSIYSRTKQAETPRIIIARFCLLSLSCIRDEYVFFLEMDCYYLFKQRIPIFFCNNTGYLLRVHLFPDGQNRAEQECLEYLEGRIARL